MQRFIDIIANTQYSIQNFEGVYSFKDNQACLKIK